MKVNKITFCGSEPITVTVKMSLKEAAFIAKLVGEHSGTSADAVIPKGSDVIGIYNDFTGGLFNRFWDDGLDGAIKEME